MTNLTAAVARYFGRKEGQTLTEFQKEIKALTHADKCELASMLTVALGETVELPRPPA